MLRVLTAVAVVATLLSSPSQAAEPEFVLTVASVAPQDSPWSALLQKFEKAVEEKTNKRIDVRLKIGGVLGDENETVTKCRRGQIQAVAASTGALASIVPELNLVELPYLFRNAEEADHVIDTVLTVPMEKFFKDRGLILGFWNENGFRHFGTQGSNVKTPADLKGKKMRVQENPVHIAMYKALGAAAVPIPTTEVPQALATGNVDGFDQSALYAIAASWTRSIKFFTVSEHIYQPAAIAFNAEWFQKLPKELQDTIVTEGRTLQVKGRKAARQIFPELVEMLKAEGITVYTLSPAEKAVFEKAVQPVYAEYKKAGGKEAAKLLEATQKSLAALRGGK